MFDFFRIGTFTTTPVEAGKAIVAGLGVILVIAAVITWLGPAPAAVAIGVLLAVVTCFVLLVGTARSFQYGAFGALLGISVDGGYAQVTDQTPVTIANALIAVAKNITAAVTDVASSAGLAVSDVAPLGVWSYILSAALFMGISFAVRHKDEPAG